MRSSAWPLIAAFLLAGPFTPLRAGLGSLETEDLRLLYLEPNETYITPHVARCFENSLRFHRDLFHYTPSEKVTVFLSDFSDKGNASANSVPRDHVLLEIAPLSFAYETVAPNERMNWLMNHELVHVAATDKAAGSDLFFRKLFAGKVSPIAEHPESIFYFYLTTPRNAAPSWYQEGIAVFIETWMAGGLGRAQGAYDEMVFRSKVRDGSYFYDPLGLASEGGKIDFQVGVNYYLYGTRFMSYLAYRHGPESLIDWIGRSKGDKKYYASQFKQVYGASLREVWRDWIEWEHEFQRRNLDAIREFPTTAAEDLSSQALGSVSRPFYDPDTNTLYAAFNYPGVVAHLGAIALDDGSVRKIVDVKDPALYFVTYLAWDPHSKTLFYTTDHHAFRDLRAVKLEDGRSRVLLKDARIGELVFNPADRSIWGVRYLNGIATLVRVPEPYGEWFQVHSWPYGEVPYDLDISPDGRLLAASVGEIDGRHSLRVMETDALLAGEVEALHEVDFGNTIPSNFVFSPDGRYLYGSSYYTGVSNIFRYELATEELEAVSNTDGGFFRPTPLADGSLIVFRYTGEGFVAARIDPRPLEDINPITFLGQQIVEKYPQLEEWSVGSPARVPIESMITRKGDYHSFKSVGVESVYPVVEGYKDYPAYGFRLNLSDPLSLNRTSLTTSYTPNSGLPDNEKLHMKLEYERYDWRASAKLNPADFYDLFGPTKTGLKGYSLGTGYKRTLIFDEPRKLELDVSATHYGNLERLPRYQNVPVTFDKLTELVTDLGFQNMRSSLGAVDYEKGVKARGLLGASYVDGDLIPAAVANFDFGFALPLHHSSIWLRNSVGAAFGMLDDPFANFYFGGFGNNWVDHGPVKRYREYYSFPGTELNEVGGRNYVKSMLEWNLPPLRFRRAGSPGFFITWARASLFAGGIRTNLDESSAERELTDVGAQIDFRFNVLSRLDLTLSLGYAVAFESGFDSRDEFMASLKILR